MPNAESAPPRSPHVSDPSIGDLLRNLVDDTRRLVRDEIDLARTEISEKARHALRESIILGIGVFLALIAFTALMAAITFGLAHALSPLVGLAAAMWLSPLIIALLAGAIGGLLVRRGLLRLKPEKLAPTRTIESLRETGQMLADRLP